LLLRSEHPADIAQAAPGAPAANRRVTAATAARQQEIGKTDAQRDRIASVKMRRTKRVDRGEDPVPPVAAPRVAAVTTALAAPPCHTNSRFLKEYTPPHPALSLRPQKL
jgi:hypothetical protein